MKEFLRPSYGQQLAEARAAKGLSIADVATKLKLTARQVEAMEAEDAQQLPGDVFLRGFVRNYARLLELNLDDLIVPMDAQVAVAETITAPSEGVTLGSGNLKRWLVVPLVILGVFVIFVAALYQWLRQGEDVLVPQTSMEPSPAVVTQPVPLPAGASVPLTVPEVPATTTAAAPDALPAPADALEPPRPQAAPVLASAETPPSAAVRDTEAAVKPKPAAVPPVPATTNTHILRFQANQDAWIQVVDGEGRRFSKLVRAGGSDSITGKAPFKLVVGEAAQVRLSYDGHAIDLTPYIGQKVARLTLE